MLNVELIPFVGLDVEQITPYDKYEDLNKKKTHYYLNSQHVETTFDPIKNYKELKSDKTFQAARKYIRQKEILSIKEYDKLCSEIANNMNLSQDDLDRNQRFMLEMNKIAHSAFKSKGKFDKTK